MSHGTVQLQSSQLAAHYSGDRRCFLCIRRRAFGGKLHFQALTFPKAFVFIDLPTTKGNNSPGGPDAIDFGMATLVGGLLGGVVGAKLASMAAGGGPNPSHVDQTYEMASDEQIAAIMKKRRNSFIVPYDDIQSAVIAPPGAFSNMSGHILVKAKTIRRLQLEPIGEEDMIAAIGIFRARLRDRVDIRTAFDRSQMRFVKA